MILYVNGCSWSCQSNETLTDKVYGDYLAEKLNIPLINHSALAASNDRIIRSTVRNLQKILKTEKDIICVLNLTTLTRVDLWGNDNKLQSNKSPITKEFFDRYKKANDGDYISFNISSEVMHKSTESIPEFDIQIKSFLANYHYEKEWYELYYRLFMLITYFKQNNIKYLIFAGAPLSESASVLDPNLEWISVFRDPIINDPAILNFDDINFRHWAHDNGYKSFDGHIWPMDPTGRPYGHPGPAAHAAWADFLYNKLTELYGPL